MKFRSLLRSIESGELSAAGRVADRTSRSKLVAEGRATVARMQQNVDQQRAALLRQLFHRKGLFSGKGPKFSSENASEAASTKGMPTVLQRLHAYNSATTVPGCTAKGIRARIEHVGSLDEKLRRAASGVEALAAV